MKNWIFTTVFLMLDVFGSYAQKSYDFHSPVDPPLLLAGNFGELRSNHFHTGLDIRTNGEEGWSVYAIDDGYVERIAVSPRGYGNVLYIRHPQYNLTSVYAHLKEFSPKIEKYVKNYQYNQQSWIVDFKPNPEDLPVKKGEIIALSGNTGASAGPHLHFEIRNAYTETALNPLLFGFNIPDNTPPTPEQIYFFPLDEQTSINGKNTTTFYNLKKNNESYTLSIGDIVYFKGRIGIGFKGYDIQNSPSNRNGIYQADLYIDGVLRYQRKSDSVDFYDNRGLNALIDYPTYIMHRKMVEKCFISKCNPLQLYTYETDARVNSELKDKYEIKLIMKDFAGNQTEVKFYLVSKDDLPVPEKIEEPYEKYFNCFEKNVFVKDRFILTMQPYSLYENIKFQFKIKEKTPLTITPVYFAHNPTVPLHFPLNVAILCDQLPENLKDKAIMIRYDENMRWSVLPDKEWKGNYLVSKSKYFGGFSVAIDTVSPTIEPKNISQGRNMDNFQTIWLKISDNLSGIKKYDGFINGQWVLMEYNPRNGSVIYRFSEGKTRPGKNHFLFKVYDYAGNESIFEAEFYRN